MATFNFNRANVDLHTPMKRLARLALMLTVSTVTLLAPIAHAENKGDTLRPGKSLSAGDWLQSKNKEFRLLMQADGNLVLYRMRAGNYGGGLWSSLTFGRPGSEAVMQYDGNFVIYAFSGPIWASGTQSQPGSYLALQDDGNLVIYRPNVPVWATNTVNAPEGW
jgi:hypothetical protein